MFIGCYDLDDELKFHIYHYKGTKKYNCNEWEQWLRDTFSSSVKNIKILDFKIRGNNYQERKNSLQELAVIWQLDFSSLSWSYNELSEISNFFEVNGKRYGLLKEFKENCVC